MAHQRVVSAAGGLEPRKCRGEGGAEMHLAGRTEFARDSFQRDRLSVRRAVAKFEHGDWYSESLIRRRKDGDNRRHAALQMLARCPTLLRFVPCLAPISPLFRCNEHSLGR